MTTVPTSALLPQEPVLLVQGRLAAALGLAPALFLQQVHYWLLRSPHQYGGQPWIYNTYSQWQVQFPFLSRDQLARAVARLRRLGVLQVAHWDADRRERRNWYSIDYARLAGVLATGDQPTPAIADLVDSVFAFDPASLPDTNSAPAYGPNLTAIAASPLPAAESDEVGMSARPCLVERTLMMQIGTMDDSEKVAHPEITPAEITQRLPQEEDAPPGRSRSAERGTQNGVTESGPCAVFLCPALPPSAPGGADPPDANGPLSAIGIMSTMFAFPPAVPAVADRRTSRSLPLTPPTSAFVWGVYRATLDPAAPVRLRTRIAADLAGAVARGVPLTPRGLAYALNEAATARGPRWPYLFAVWQAHPDGDGGTRSTSPTASPCGQRGSNPNPTYQGPNSRAGHFPPPLNASKYAPGGKYGHLFARPAAAVT